MTLRETFDEHQGRLVGKIDHFFEVYEPHLARYRNTPVRVLELGIFRGGSLELWRHYFGPEAQIVAVDIDMAAIESAPDDVTLHLGSTDDASFMESVLADGPFDICIDDASHRVEHQISAFEQIYPRMAERAVYICEDAFTSYWPNYGGGLGRPGTFIEYAKGLVDDLHPRR